jgi:putative endonuclease
MPSDKRKVGDWGEGVAEFYLKNKGYEIIEKNFNTRYGEIDLICKKGGRFIFVEVKTRSNLRFGTPEEAVTRKKQEHLIAVAQIYISSKNINDTQWQIDVLAVEGEPGVDKIAVRHIENAVSN